MQGSKYWRNPHFVAFLLVIVLALCLRLTAAWIWQAQADREGTLFRFGDSESYWVLGQTIANGTDYEYLSPNSKVFRVPSYPILLSTVAWVQPQRTAVMLARVVGCVLGTLCVALLYWLTRRVAWQCFASRDDDQRLKLANLAALAAAVFSSTYLGAIGMSIFVLSEAIFCPFMLCSLTLLWLACDYFSTYQLKANLIYAVLVASGIASGCAILARPSWILWPAVVFIYWFVVVRSPDLETILSRAMVAIRCTFVFSVGIIFVMTPWWMRNYDVTHQFIPTTLQVGASLYDSFHAGTTGGSDTGMTFSGDFAKELAKEREARQASGEPQTAEDSLSFEVALDKRLRNAAIDWMLQNPSDAARLSLVKFWRTWTPLPQAAQLGGGALRIAEAIGYLAILSMAVVAIVWILPRRDPALLFALPCIYFAMIHSVFVGSVRYRQPAVLALCVIAGIGTAWIVVKCKRTPQHQPTRM
jgi:hypothetical protein